MDLAENIKRIRTERGMLQKQVAAEIGLKPAHYNKLEKGLVEPSVKILDSLAKLFGVSIDQIVHLESGIPEEVVFEDKTVSEKVRLIEKLDEKDKGILYGMLDTMLTKKKFKDFFNQNVALL